MILCPTLAELPPPPLGKTGWPWTEESSQLPATMPNGEKWPRVSIITPNYNYGKFIEGAIRSILLQGYQDLEYIIIDGESNDYSVEIIQRYEIWISYWHSQKDEGQSDAINQGFSKATGDILCWINSDDLLEKNSLSYVVNSYKPGLNWWSGKAKVVFPDTSKEDQIYVCQSLSKSEILHGRAILPQVSTFWTRELWHEAGAYILPLYLAMDYDLWLRFSSLTEAKPIDYILGIINSHEEAKTGTSDKISSYLDECNKVRLSEYKKMRTPFLFRMFLIAFWFRVVNSKRYHWTFKKAWFTWLKLIFSYPSPLI